MTFALGILATMRVVLCTSERVSHDLAHQVRQVHIACRLLASMLLSLVWWGRGLRMLLNRSQSEATVCGQHSLVVRR